MLFFTSIDFDHNTHFYQYKNTHDNFTTTLKMEMYLNLTTPTVLFFCKNATN